MHIDFLFKIEYVCWIPKGFGMEQVLTKLAVKILFDDSTGFCLFVWFDYLRQINTISVMKGRVFLDWASIKLELMCLTVTLVRLKPAAHRSRVKHSTNESLCSLYWFWWDEVDNYFTREAEIMDIVYVLDKD